MKQVSSKICVILILVLITLLFSACEDLNSSKLEYEINVDGKTCTITGLGSYEGYELVIPEQIGGYTVTAIGDYAFRESEIERVIMADTVVTIGKEAFSYCYYITDIELSDNLKTIGEGAFAYCSSLERIEIPGSVRILPEYLFYGSNSLKSVSLNEGLVRIKNAAFYDCAMLQEITFPSTLQYIGEMAFAECDALTEIVLPNGLIEFDFDIFSSCKNLSTISFPSSLRIVSIPFAAESHKLSTILVDSNSLYYKAVDGVLYDKTMTMLLCYPAGKEQTSFIIPDTVIEIYNCAFTSNKNIQIIYIPKSVKVIGPGVFAETVNLKELHYEGTIVEWNSISKDSQWNAQSPNFTIYCTDGQISKGGTVTYN